MKTEFKDMRPSFRDIDLKKGQAIIKHAAWNLDRVDDEIEKTAFDWQYKAIRGKPDIAFLLNHHSEQTIGDIMKVFTDDEGAYSVSEFGKDPLSQGLLEMADQKALSGVSLGYEAKDYTHVFTGKKRIRRIKKIFHGETSILVNNTPANPQAGIMEVHKSVDYVKERIETVKNMERFLSTSRKAPDSLLEQVAIEVKAIKSELSEMTADEYFDNLDRLERKLNTLSGEIKGMQTRVLINQIKRLL